MLALTSQTGGGRSVGIVRVRTNKATELFETKVYYWQQIHTYVGENIEILTLQCLSDIRMFEEVPDFSEFHFLKLIRLTIANK